MSEKNKLEVIRHQSEVHKARIEELQKCKFMLGNELCRINDQIEACKQILNRLRLDAKLITNEKES